MFTLATRSTRLASALALTLALTLAACSTTPRSGRTQASPVRTPSVGLVRIDGDTRDWEEDRVAVADEHDLSLRFAVLDAEGEPFTLQAASESVVIALDLDDSDATGHVRPLPDVTGLGIDLEIHLSPIPSEGGDPGRGVEVYAYDAGGARIPLRHADIDFAFAPTVASTWYEARISRRIDLQDLPIPGLRSQGTVRGAILIRDRNARVVGCSEPFTADCPAIAPERRRVDVTIPAPAPEALRVVSWNVLRASPMTRPDTFARLLQVLEPDVVLLQEWDDASARDLVGWFTALVPTDGAWHAHVHEDQGVAIVSRHPFSSHDVDLVLEDVRCVAADVETPIGTVRVASLHLKCCGSSGSPEDLRRIDQATIIREHLASYAPIPTVVAGDINLVGSRTPLDILREGLDVDGSALGVVCPDVLGDTTVYTWRDDDSAFTPGRLDYAVLSDGAFDLVRAFVVDTSRLTLSSLYSMGLDPDDSRGSDHMPVVIDLVAFEP